MATLIANEPAHSARNIILCFDGTGNKFGEHNSNVIHLFRALVKKDPRQLVYYQPGIGTYMEHHYFTRSASYLASVIDQGIALDLNDHVKEGYQYIMHNYRPGDNICLFGFSRGAHTARVVAGMLYKVGILPPHNDQQVDFAFSVYQKTGNEGDDLSKEFKQTFAMPATVKFVGVWDTVSSVGIIPRSHPYTSVNYAVQHFRHALALDERRARFRPNFWCEPTPGREQELDVDEHSIKIPEPGASRENWSYSPPDRDICDVQEVWFAGCHADIGGGSHPNKIRESLSHIPLRWMIKESLLAGSGILFDLRYLKSLGINVKALSEELKAKGHDPNALGFTPEALKELEADKAVILAPHRNLKHIHTNNHPSPRLLSHVQRIHENHVDILAKIFDQLSLVFWWWILELLPLLVTYQKADGNWVRRRMRNFGQGRYIPLADDGIKVHVSVKIRIEESEKTDEPYIPAAYNWSIASTSEKFMWVGDEEEEKKEEEPK